MFDETFLFSPEGQILGSYQKTFLMGSENDYCITGTKGLPVFDTELGRIGLYICMDGVIPEPPRTLALGGAQILLDSLHSPALEESEFIIPSRAVENGVWIISANRAGSVTTPRGTFQFAGRNLIVSPDGKIVAKGTANKEEIVYGEVFLGEINRKESINGGLFEERRPELYSSLANPNSTLEISRIRNESSNDEGSNVTISVIQNSRSEDPEDSLDRALGQCVAVAEKGTKIIVLPELFLQGKVVEDPEAAVRISQKAIERFSSFCSKAKVYAALSLVEDYQGRYYSTLHLVGDEGQIVEKYRKTHLSGLEKTWASQGQRFVVAPTKYGNLGLMLGSEIMFPEVARSLMLMGAHLILYPCNWTENYQYDWLVKTRTVENHICIAAANRIDSPAKRGSIITPIVTPFISFRENKSVDEIFSSVIGHGVVGELSLSTKLLTARNKLVGYKTDVVLDRKAELYKPITTINPTMLTSNA